MFYYNSNFPHEIQYNGQNVNELKYNSTSVWLAPKATGLTYFNTDIFPSMGSFRFGFITTCPCKVEIYFRSVAGQRWSRVYNRTWTLSELIAHTYTNTYSVQTPNGIYIYPAGYNKFLYSNIDVSSNYTIDNYYIIIYDTVTDDILYDSRGEDTWTTDSCTCTASPTSYNTTYLNSTTTYTTNVTITSYATETSSEGGSRTVAVTPTASISNTNVITNVSFTHVSGNTYRMIVNFKRNVIGSSTVTIRTSRNGKTDTATYTISISQPEKSMTLVFRQVGIQNVFLFSGPATSNLSTSAIEAYVMSGDTNRLTISWTSTLYVNSPTGDIAQISEGQPFYVYYTVSGASTISQCTLSPTHPTLEDGATVQLA